MPLAKKMKRRARQIRDKVLMHIDAFQGAGKTTLMNQLQQEFPDITFRDVDDFVWKGFRKAYKELGVKGDNILANLPPGVTLEQFYDVANRWVSSVIKEWADKQKKDVVLVGMAHSETGAYPNPAIPKEYNKNYDIPAEKRYRYDVPSFKVAFRGTKRWINVPTLESLLLILRKKEYRDQFLWAYKGAKNVTKHLADLGYEPRTAKLLRQELQAHVAGIPQAEALSQDLATIYTPHQVNPPLVQLMGNSQTPEQAAAIENQALLAARKGTFGNVKGDSTSPAAGRSGMASADSGSSDAGGRSEHY